MSSTHTPAIVGMSCELPGINGVAQLWDLLSKSKEARRDRDSNEFALQTSTLFDPDFFGITAAEATTMDPHQRKALELAWRAVENSRIPFDSLPSGTGVYMAATLDEYGLFLSSSHVGLSGIRQTDLAGSMAANRVSQFLDLHGPSLAIDTGQSSSLVAVHMACEAVSRGEVPMAIVGAVQLNLSDSYRALFDQMGVLSSTNQCRAFDAGADGFVRGEGGAFIVVMPLEDALDIGGTVYGTFRATGINQDGARSTLTMPSVDQQVALIRQVLEKSDLGPDDVDFVELHGTGTPQGDIAEATALTQAFAGRGNPEPILVGSIKTNVGHLQGASGIVGVVKAALSIQHRILPPSLNFNESNLAMRGVRAVEMATEPSRLGDRRTDILGGVSSFGLGGTNAHVILGSAPLNPKTRTLNTGNPVFRGQIELPFLVSARTPAGLAALSAEVSALRKQDEIGERGEQGDVANGLAWGLAIERSGHPYRTVLKNASSGEDCGYSAASNQTSIGQPASRCVFVFPGQGAQWTGMASELLQESPVFLESIRRSDAALREFQDWTTEKLIRERADLDRLSNATVQPLLWAVMIGISEVWIAAGIRPSAVVGHSQGEIAAAYVAGILSLKDSAEVVVKRSQLIDQLASHSGKMLAVGLSRSRALNSAEELGLVGIELAVVNSPAQCVVSGPSAEIDRLARYMTASGVRSKVLPVGYAGHSSALDVLMKPVVSALDVTPSATGVRFVSSVASASAQVGTGRYWYENLRLCVDFQAAVERLINDGHEHFLEVSPHPILVDDVQEIAFNLKKTVNTHRSTVRNVGDVESLVDAFATSWRCGLRVDWALVGAGVTYRMSNLPEHPFERRHYSIDPVDSAGLEADSGSGVSISSVPQSLPLSRATRPQNEHAITTSNSKQIIRLALSMVTSINEDELDLNRRFVDLGVDSVALSSLAATITRLSGIHVRVSTLFERPNGHSLAEYISEGDISVDMDTSHASKHAEFRYAGGVVDEPMAVVGVGCRVPGGVGSGEELLEFVVGGGDAISGFPVNRGAGWLGVYDADVDAVGKCYARGGGFLHDADEFDASFFGISPREALAMDPQQRVLLEASWRALEHAGIAPDTLRGTATGVYIGMMAEEYGETRSSPSSKVSGHVLTGSSLSVASGRIAYLLGLEGPAITVDTACSSSLVALHLASQALRSGECDLALAGGVTIMSSPGTLVEFSRQQGLSVDGRCRSFSDDASGTGFAEGVGVVVVERLSDAIRNGHEVLGLVRGSAVNQDGASNGLTAPNGLSQQRVIQAAARSARIDLAEVDVVEAHGTGTRLGDPIEADALLATYGSVERSEPLYLGSIKSNIGHTQAAAGVVGVIKMIMAMRGGVLPPSLHVGTPSKQVDWESGRIELLRESREWPTNEWPRRAGVSSFGISGTNAHVILEQAPPSAVPAPVREPRRFEGAVVPWIVTAKSETSLRKQAGVLLGYLDNHPNVDLAAIGKELRGRSQFAHRAVVFGSTREQLREGLQALSSGASANNVVAARADHIGSSPVFVFPGQGSQWPGMAKELYASSQAFQVQMQECADALAPYTDWSLLDAVEGDLDLTKIDIVQPFLWATMVSLARLWEEFGVTPAAVIGHSQGEVAAGYISGALSLHDAAKLAALRSKALTNLSGNGGMIAVSGVVGDLDNLLDSCSVELAARNSTSLIVVAGSPRALEDVKRYCDEHGGDAREVAVDYASHSGQMESIRDEILALSSQIASGDMRVPFISTVLGDWITEFSSDYWYRNLRETVSFSDAVERLIRDGFTRFVEVSPHPVLSVGVDELLDVSQSVGTIVGTLRRDQIAGESFVEGLSRLFVSGVSVDWSPFFDGVGVSRLHLPEYQFDRQSFWLKERPSAEFGVEGVGGALFDVDWVAVGGSGSGSGYSCVVVGGSGDVWGGVEFESVGGLIASVVAGGAVPDVVVVVCRGDDVEDVVGSSHRVTSWLLGVMQEWLSCEAVASSKLVVVTSGAVSVSGGGVDDLGCAPLWGLLRSAQSEFPGRFVVMDVAEFTDGCGGLLARGVSSDEPQLAVRDGQLLVPRLGELGVGSSAGLVEFDSAGSVLITGGTGTLGSLVAEHLVVRYGVQNLILLSRSGMSAAGADDLRQRLEELGATVVIEACDVSVRSELAGVLERIPVEHPLKGVVHTAGSLEDATFENTTSGSIDKVFEGKVDAAWYLHELTADLDLDAFILYSSFSGILGAAGQANYAAANTFLDALAAYRQHDGRVGLSVAWGLWDDASGMTAGLGTRDHQRIADYGLRPITASAGMNMLDRALLQREPLVAATSVGSDSGGGPRATNSMWRSLVGAPAETDFEVRSAELSYRDSVAAQDADGRYAFVYETVAAEVADVLGFSSGNEIDPDMDFKNIGFDSLMAVEVRNRVGAITGLRLPATVIFNYPNTRMLTDKVLSDLIPEKTDSTNRSAEFRYAGGVVDEPMAVVGVGCRVPGGVGSGEELLEFVVGGGDAISGFPVNRGAGWLGVYDADVDAVGKCYARGGGFLHDADEFDASFFGISPREALAMDPQQRVLLEASWRALEHAGIAPDTLRGTATGVYIGMAYNTYTGDSGANQDISGHVLTGSSLSVASGRIAYLLGLEGPAITVDTACSSSLVALHLASQALRSGECDLALAGGVTIMSSPGTLVEFSRQQGLSVDGRCRSFSDDASGTGFAEGVGVVVVERLSDAIRNGHEVLGLVRGSAVNQDGASNGLTAPNGLSQQRVIQAAARSARIDLAEVDVVEAHGTGTRLGDPIEADALLATYGSVERSEPLYLGSIKSNIGHTQAAAGVVGVIKMIMAMRGGVLPPSLHVGTPSKQVDWESGRIELLRESREWPTNEWPRRAGVSSFGISGTNAHVILEQAPPSAVPAPVREPRRFEGAVVPWIVTAKSETSLRKQAGVLLGYLDNHPNVDLAAIGNELRGRSQFAHRAVVFGSTREQLREGLQALSSGASANNVVAARADHIGSSPVFVFPGQGSQWPGMAKELYENLPTFADSYAAVCATLGDAGKQLLSRIAEVTKVEGLASSLMTQLSIYAFELAMVAALNSFGVKASAVVGHSVGEFAAAVTSGWIEMADASRIIAARATAMASAPAGSMCAIEADVADVNALLAANNRLHISAFNSPTSTVVGGDVLTVDRFIADMSTAGQRVKRLDVSNAFHTPMMAASAMHLKSLVGQFDGTPLRADTIRTPMFSSVTGDAVDESTPLDADYWGKNIVDPVNFWNAFRKATEKYSGPVLESGPSAAMTTVINGYIGDALCVPTYRHDVDRQLDRFVEGLSRLFVSGVSVDWSPFFDGVGVSRLHLPEYQFDRQSFWLKERPSAEFGVEGVGGALFDVDWVAVGGSGSGSGYSCVVVGGSGDVWGGVEFESVGGLIASVVAGGAVPDVVVVVCRGDDVEDVVGSSHRVTSWLLGVMQEWLSCEAVASSKLVVVTSGAVSVSGGGVDDLGCAPLWGLLRSAQSEFPGRFVVMDVAEFTDGCGGLLARGVSSDEPQLAVRDGQLLVPRLGELGVGSSAGLVEFDSAGSVLITGGTGTLGSLVAEHLVVRYGVQNLILLSRSGMSAAGADDLRQRLEELGATVVIEACDVSVRSELAGVLERIPVEHPLKGVVHTAGSLEDATFENTTSGSIDKVFEGKVDAAWYLHELTADLDLDAFILYSSFSGILGAAGQANYAAANTFLDALAAYRQHDGRVGLSVAWGLWDDASGMTAGLGTRDHQRIADYGLRPITASAGMNMLDRALLQREPLVAATSVGSDSGGGPRATNSMWRSLVGAPAETDFEVRSAELSYRDSVAAQDADGRYAFVYETVAAEVADVLGFSSGNEIDPDMDFKNIGFDSLMAVEVRNRVGAITGLRLPATVIFNYPNTRMLTDKVLSDLIPEKTDSTNRSAEFRYAGGVVDEPMAVVGVGCRVPGGVGSGEELLEFVVGGGDAISGFPVNRGAGWLGVYDADVDAVGKCYARGGGFLHDADEFDASFFGISPREALAMDPQQRVLLEASWRALEHAGIAPDTLRGTATGVYIGVSDSDYLPRVVPQELEGLSSTGATTSVASGRIAYLLGLEGPAITINTACSSSLVALHLASQALRSGECDLALAGGVTIMSSPQPLVEFSRQQGLSVDGRCRSFSDDASGTGFAEGVGVVVVERLSDAIRNGHEVLGLVRGSAVNQDGASNGLTAPNGLSQQRVIQAAARSARIDLAEVDVVEAHGTGTRLGDPIEADALLATYGSVERSEPLYLGSIKSNIGHTQAAAGVVGVIKMIMAMRGGVLPPSLHVGTPSKQVDWESGRIELLRESREWPTNEWPRRAGVSSFGISGTNAHVILEQAPPSAVPAPVREPRRFEGAVVPWIVTAKSETSLRKQAGVLLGYLDNHPNVDLAAIGNELRGRSQFAHRAVVFGSTREQLREGLQALSSGASANNVVAARADHIGSSPVFVFPGQGSQWPGMAKELYASSQAFQVQMQECADALAPYTDWSLLDAVEGDLDLTKIDIVQPFLWATMVSLARLWEEFGVTPAAVIGHSQGEVAAGYISGALSLHDAAKLAALRSKALTNLSGNGGMIAVSGVVGDLDNLLDSCSVELAARNSTSLIVVAGSPRALEDVKRYCDEHGGDAREVAVDYASHSGQMESIRDEILALSSQIASGDMRVPFISTVLGDWITEFSSDYWYRNLRETVSFSDAVERLIRDGFTRFVEVSPHPVLSVGVDELLDVSQSVGTIVGTLRRDQIAGESFVEGLSRLFVSGVSVDWSPFFDGVGVSRLHLPEYQFDRQSFWLKERPSAEFGGAGIDRFDHPFLRGFVEGPDDGRIYFGRISRSDQPWLSDHMVGGRLIVPGTAVLEAVCAIGVSIGSAFIDELVLEVPIELNPDGHCDLRVMLVALQYGRFSVEVMIRATQEASWVRCASAELSAAGGDGREGIGSWPPADGAEHDIEALYSSLSSRGLHYGPSFQGVKRAWTSGEAVLADVAIQSELDTVSDFLLHPALLDSALHCTALIDEDFAGVPFSFSGVDVRAAGASELRVRASRVEDGSRIEMFDHANQLVLNISRLAVRGLPDEERPSAEFGVEGVGGALFDVDWVAVGGSGSGSGYSCVVVGGSGDVWGGVEFESVGGLIASVVAGGAVPDVVVVVCRGDDVEDVVGSSHRVTSWLLGVMQEWLSCEAVASSKLVVVTSGAVSVSGGGVDDLGCAPLWGLLRSAQSEFPGRFVVMDVAEFTDGCGGLLARGVSSDEPQLAVRDGQLLVPRLGELGVGSSAGLVEFDSAGSVLITGGTGTLGSLVAEHLVVRYGVQNLILLSRSGMSAAGADDLRQRLEELGATVVIEACDVSVRSELAGVLERIPVEHPLKGVVHTAGSLEDATFENTTSGSIDKVFEGKVDAAWYLHELTADLDLDAFILYSSFSGILGAAGQANYAAANTFLDALAAYRQHDGRVGLSVAWGLWDDASGMTAGLGTRDHQRIADYGLRPITASAGMNMLDRALLQREPLVAATSVGSDSGGGPRATNSMWRSLVGAPAETDFEVRSAELSYRDSVAAQDADGRYAFVYETVAAEVADVLGFSSGNEIDPDMDFKNIGFDSLMAVEVRNRVGAITGLRLPATVIFNYPNTRMLTDKVLSDLIPEKTDNELITILREAAKLLKLRTGLTLPNDLKELLLEVSKRNDLSGYEDMSDQDFLSQIEDELNR